MSERDQKNQNTTMILSFPGSHLIRYRGCKMQPRRHKRGQHPDHGAQLDSVHLVETHNPPQKIPGALIFLCATNN
jgi:hypothetical protein